MLNRENQKTLLEDYSLKEVPYDKRKSWIDVSMVWIGVAIVMSALLRGMMIGMGLGSLDRVIMAYILGELILIGMMTLTGYIGAKLGLSTPLISRITFGVKGSFIMSLCLALSFMGWFGIQAGLFAETLFSYSKTSIPVPYLAFLSGIFMMIPAIFGFKGLKALSWAVVPPMIIVFIYVAFKMKFDFLPSDKLVNLAMNHSPSPYPVTLGGAASIIAGGFIVGAVTSADVFRYAKPRFRDILFSATLSMGVSAIMQLVGSVLAMRTGLYHEKLPDIIISPEYAGLGIIGFLAIAFAQWTTNDSNLYSSVLAFNNIIRWTRWKLAVVVGILSSFLASLGILQRLGLFLSLLSIGVSPIGGIIIADFYLLRRVRKIQSISNPDREWNPVAVGVYLISFIIGWVTSGHPLKIKIFPFSIYAFNGIISAVILYWAGMKLFKNFKEDSN
jgi:cytosine permease